MSFAGLVLWAVAEVALRPCLGTLIPAGIPSNSWRSQHAGKDKRGNQQTCLGVNREGKAHPACSVFPRERDPDLPTQGSSPPSRSPCDLVPPLTEETSLPPPYAPRLQLPRPPWLPRHWPTSPCLRPRAAAALRPPERGGVVAMPRPRGHDSTSLPTIHNLLPLPRSAA